MPRLDFLPGRERFLPVPTRTLIDRLLNDGRLSDDDRDCLARLAGMLVARTHFEFHRQAERLKLLYVPLDPDCDTLPAAPLSDAARDGRRRQFCAAIRRLLTDGHYVELTREQIGELVELQNFAGLRIEADLDDYREVAAFYRGVRHEDRMVWAWHNFWRKRPRTCTVFSRAALVVRTATEDDRLHIKLFKNIVAEDMEMLLPRVRVRMRWVDGLKIGSSVAGSVATAIWKAFTTALLSPWLFLIMLTAFLTPMVRAFAAFVTSKTRYMQALSANLYFQNLANNSSALSHLVDSAEAETVKEMLLAYFLLYIERQREFTAAELGQRASQWVHETFDHDIEFDISDAVGELIDKGLVVRRDPGTGREIAEGNGDSLAPSGEPILTVYDLPSAIRRLDEAWDNLFTQTDDRTASDDRLAAPVRGKWVVHSGQGNGDNHPTAVAKPVAHRDSV